jgi:hypothetical protein
LDDNHDVAISGATNGQFLQYNSVTDYWVPSSSGNFSTLLVNGTGVSVSGHTHTTSNITDFNSGVSGLLPSVSGSGYAVSSFENNVYTISVTGLQPSGDYSVVGHTHTSSNITDFSESVQDVVGVSGFLISGTGININYNDNSNTLTISTSGLQPSGNYANTVHSHTSSDITDFNSSVSGLLPTITNSGNNRILTSTGSSTGIHAESNLTFDGDLLSISSGLLVSSPSGFISANFEPIQVPAFGQSATLRLVESNRGFGPTISINYHGDNGAETDSEGVRHRATPRIALIKSSGTYENPTALGGWEALSVIRTEAIGQSGLSLVGRMVTWADGAVGGSNIYQPSRMTIEVSSGPNNLDRNISIFSNGSVTTNCSLSVDQGLSAPTPIFSLGTVSGNVSINYGIDKQIQTLTLNGTATNFIEGSGWDIASKSVDVLLEITVTNTTTVTWTLIDDQYNAFPTFIAGKYLVLLRSMGTTIQGHYIGDKTN